MAKKVIREEGVPVGISSGAAVQAALNYAGKEGKGKTIVVILPSSTERYLSTLLAEEARTKATLLSVAEVTEAMLNKV